MNQGQELSPDAVATVDTSLFSRITLGPFRSLRHPGYRNLWLGQVFTSGGYWMDQVARGWLIYELTDSPFQLGVVSALRAIPMLLFSLAAGVTADRFDRRKQLEIAQGFNLVLNLILAVLILTGRVEVWHIFLTALLAGTAQAFQQPARQAIIPLLVPKQDLANALGLSATALSLMRTLGTAVAGGLIALIGVDGSYFFQAFLYAAAIVVTERMAIPEIKLTARAVSPLQSLVDGFRYVRNHQIVGSVMLLALIPIFFGGPYLSLMPVFARDVLAAGPSGLGLLLSASGVGAIIGAYGVSSVRVVHRRGLLMMGGVVLFGLGLMAFSFSAWLPLSLLLMAVIGISSTGYHVIVNTVLHSHTPDDLRGRVISFFLLNQGLQPLGTLLAGALADAITAPTTVVVLGGVVTFLGLTMAARVPVLRRLD